MINHAPNIFKGKEILAIGESNLSDNLKYPLQLCYTSLFICTAGSAVISVNFKNYLLKANDILVLAEDYITVTQRISSDFEIFYCLIDRSLAAEIAYDLPNQLFLYLNKFPLFTPQSAEINLLQGWISQIKDIKDTCQTHQRIMLRNHLQNFFLKIAEKVSLATINIEINIQGKRYCVGGFGN